MNKEERVARLESASITAANEGLKALLLLNGGACIALLGFIATTISQPNLPTPYAVMVQWMIRSMVAFSIGAGLSVLTSLFAYLSNQAYATNLMEPTAVSWKIGQRWNNAATVTAILSLTAFFVGVALIWHSAPV